MRKLGITILVTLAASLICLGVWEATHQPGVRDTGPASFKASGYEPRELTPSQATSLRRILNSPAQYDLAADPVVPSGFFYVDGRCFYWRGRSLSISSKHGPHRVWRGGTCLERMASHSLKFGRFRDEATVREFLAILDSPDGLRDAKQRD